jgi:hypothetical protein
MYSFNPIETQTLKERAEMAKTNSETINNLYSIGAIDKASSIKMVDVIGKDPQYLAQNIHDGYKKDILSRADKGEFITANSDKIELAKSLNQMKQASDGKGVSGSENPLSGIGKDEGGNPKEPKGVLKKHELNPAKGKE